METCEQTGVRLIVGCELGFVLLHVENHAGYSNLCRVLTHAHSQGVELAALDVDFLSEHAEGLWCTALPNGQPHDVARLRDAFGSRLSLAVRRLMDGEDAEFPNAVGARKIRVPLVATGVRFAKRSPCSMSSIASRTASPSTTRGVSSRTPNVACESNRPCARFTNIELCANAHHRRCVRFSMRELGIFSLRGSTVRPRRRRERLLRKLVQEAHAIGATIP
jgi:DNA polymerase III alpha subunit